MFLAELYAGIQSVKRTTPNEAVHTKAH